MKKLPYVYDQLNRLTPARLQSLPDLRKYVRDVLDWQVSHRCTYLVAPFHFSSGLGSEWMAIDLKLLSEAREYLDASGRKEQLFAGVCTRIEGLTDEEGRKALVNAYSRQRADGYLFYVEPIQERTNVPAQLFSYLSVLLDFRQLGVPVVAGRVGNMGLGALALGVDAFETGIASLTSFSEQDMLEDRPSGYTMQVRYYMPEMLASLAVELVTDILGAREFAGLACKCPYCGGRTDAAIARTAKEHFLYWRTREVDELNALAETDRIPAFLKRVERADRLTAEIRRKLALKLPPAQHFKTWLQVFPELAKRGGQPTQTI